MSLPTCPARSTCPTVQVVASASPCCRPNPLSLFARTQLCAELTIKRPPSDPDPAGFPKETALLLTTND
eukprot:3239514-Rhodomonas_salina.2